MMQRDLLEAPRAPTESDDIMISNLSRVHEINKRILRLLKQKYPTVQLTPVFDTPGRWDANYYTKGGDPNEAPISLHFERGGKKVTSYRTLVTWNLTSSVGMGLNSLQSNVNGYGADFILYSSPYNSGSPFLAFLDLDAPIDSLHFILDQAMNLSIATNDPIWIQPQRQQVGDISAAVPAQTFGGTIQVWGWGVDNE